MTFALRRESVWPSKYKQMRTGRRGGGFLVGLETIHKGNCHKMAQNLSKLY